jgi:exonuclease III
MRIIGWNICGGKDAETIATFVAATKCDVAVLSEFPSDEPTKTGNKAEALVRALKAYGLETAVSESSDINNRVLIATTHDFDGAPKYIASIEHRSCVVRVGDITVAGLYMPLENSADVDQRAAWRGVRDFAAAARAERTILIGDVNTCRYYPCFDEGRGACCRTMGCASD